MARTISSLVVATLLAAGLALVVGCVVRDPAPRTVVVGGANPNSGTVVTPGGGTMGGGPVGGGAVCSSGQPCDFTCSSGGCDVDCQSGSSCRSTCSGGGCVQTCRAGATCEFTCSGGGCNQTCEPDGVCGTTCSGGGCNTMQ